MRKEKGFTLIELLVVVAIIGILAAVGTVAYNGYTEGAKKSSSKANHASVVKYIVAEDAKCTVGTSKVFGVDLNNDDASAIGVSFNCSERTPSDVAEFAEAALKEFMNPYLNTELAVNDDGGGTDKATAIAAQGTAGQQGFVVMSADDTNSKIYVATCHSKPCTELDGDGNLKHVIGNELDVAE